MSDKEEVLARHRKEQKDVTATITGLKKQATKKNRKGVLAKCNELQESLDRKHKEELLAFDSESNDTVEEVTPESLLRDLQLSQDGDLKTAKVGLESKDTSNTAPSALQPSSKRNRQKERLARRQREIDRVKEEAAKEAENAVDYRKIEQESMNEILQLNGLQLFEIKPDGHCLFASIEDQLNQRHGKAVSIKDLRSIAADHINSNPNDFIPYMIDESSGELRDINDYTNELKNTAMWGSDMEILALSKEFDSPVKILQAGSAPMIINEDATGPELKIAFYKHSYGLGEHYNSLRDV